MSSKKVSGALAVIAISAISTQTHEGQKVNVDTKKVSEELKTELTLSLEDKSVHGNLFVSLSSLSEGIEVNSKPLAIDQAALLASISASNKDSSTASGAVGVARPDGNLATSCYSNCYGNCHRACHGSRGWR